MAKLAPIFNDAQFISGIPANGAKLFTYVAGSSTKLATYTDEAGLVAQSNPIVLNSRGEPAQPIWLTEGLSYKFVFAPSTDSDPPVSPIRTIDNITGINDATLTIDQWIDGGVLPTYVSVNSFTLAGDQTSQFHVGRRLKFTVTAGTVYGTITNSVFAALTTITVQMDSGQALDSGLSSVSYGLLTYNNPSIPNVIDAGTGISVTVTSGRATIASTSTIVPNRLNSLQGFRLTLTSGTPVTTNDVTGATTIYCTPYTSNTITLFDGTNWNIRTSNEISLALGTLTAALPYDVFCYDNANVPTLEFTAWSNSTTRATALVYQDGVLVKSGATTRRYLGTFYTTATTTTEDSQAKRFLWNYYHRKERSLLRRESTASWTYTLATLRQANNSTANQVDMVIGVNEDAVRVNLNVLLNNANNIIAAVALALDGTSTIIGQGGTGNVNAAPASTIDHLHSSYTGYVGIGRHFITWCESSQAAGTTTWYGNNTSIGVQNYSGLSGAVIG